MSQLKLWAILVVALTGCNAVFVPEHPDWFRQDILYAINHKRYIHGSPPLQMNEALNDHAQRFARSLADRTHQQLENVNYGPYGEIVYSAGGSVITPEEAVDSWYAQVNYFDPENPVFHPGYGQGTQLLWRNSREIGLGAALCPTNRTGYIVARYDPPGNIDGQFTENVPVPKLRFARSLRFRK